MFRLISLGLCAALFFSSTFILNRSMSLEGGHWYWSAALRFAWMILLLLLLFVVSGRTKQLPQICRIFRIYPLFWLAAGSVGFGLFYSLLCYSATFSPGWVIATTWQLTILASPLVLILFGRKVPRKAFAFTILIICGIVLVNLSEADRVDIKTLLMGGLPVIVAAFAYPTGNQMLWEAQRHQRRFIPRIDDPLLQDPFARVLLMTLGTIPFWLILYIAIAPPPPSFGQFLSTGLVALFSGILATTIFFHARHQASNSYELSAVDATQSAEVIFSVAGEIILLGGALPALTSMVGIVITLTGLTLFIRYHQ